MKIKLAITDTDQRYSDRLIGYLNGYYADRFEIYSFSSCEALMVHLVQNSIDVLLASDQISVDSAKLPRNMAFAYFSDSPSIDTIKGVRTVCRYQKASLIFKEILSLYSELSNSVTSYKNIGDKLSEIMLFLPASGGAGSTTVAVAAAVNLSRSGKRVLYLNFEQCGSISPLFDGEGQFTLSDVIYAIKSNKSNLKLRLESMIKNSDGVNYFDSCPVALDALELNRDDLERLLKELKETGSYDVIIIDADNFLCEKLYELIRSCRCVILICDGSVQSNAKFQKLYNALNILNDSKKLNITGKVMVLYNKFSNKTGKVLVLPDVVTLGGLPRYEATSPKQIMSEIAKSAVFNMFSK